MAMELMNPCGTFGREDKPLAARPAFSEDTVVGLFSNLKANANRFLDDIERLLTTQHGVREFVHFEKFASQPANFTHEFLNRCHVAVAAFGD